MSPLVSLACVRFRGQPLFLGVGVTRLYNGNLSKLAEYHFRARDTFWEEISGVWASLKVKIAVHLQLCVLSLYIYDDLRLLSAQTGDSVVEFQTNLTAKAGALHGGYIPWCLS